MTTDARKMVAAEESPNKLVEMWDSAQIRLQPYYQYIALGATILVVALVVWWWIAASSAAYRRRSWDAYFQAVTQGQYGFGAEVVQEAGEVGAEFDQTVAGAWANILAAEVKLRAGVNAMLAGDSDDADLDLEEAGRRFEQARAVLKPRANQDAFELLYQRATFGLAMTEESVGRPKNLEKATDLYRSLIQASPQLKSGLYNQAARERLESLSLDSTKEFYAEVRKLAPPVFSPPGSAAPSVPGLPQMPNLGAFPGGSQFQFPTGDPGLPNPGLPNPGLPNQGVNPGFPNKPNPATESGQQSDATGDAETPPKSEGATIPASETPPPVDPSRTPESPEGGPGTPAQAEPADVDPPAKPEQPQQDKTSQDLESPAKEK